jgi:ABC-2 type transport system ATP-binding protein
LSAPAVEVKGLTVRFGRFTAVDDVSFSVGAGEVFGFLGANGAGKTTTIRVLCGLLVPDAGTVRVAGRDLADGLDPVKRSVGYMSQRFTLYPDLTVEENLAFTASLRKMDAAAYGRRKGELMSLVGFSHDPGSLVRDLPPGVRQQVSLMNATLHDPPVVFLDEPTAGVTPASRTRFWRLIARMAGLGKTVFVTTHYLDEAEQCKRIALMRAGRIIALDTPSGLKASAFPLPMVELSGELGRSRDALSRAGTLSPHGMRWHLAVADTAAWEAARPGLPAGVTAREIPPSLEDVFIRLVEGTDR